MKSILFCLSVLLTGCAATRPVSSVSDTKESRDSIVVVHQSNDTTKTITERLEQKIIPGSSAKIDLSKAGLLDSIAKILRSMPASVSRTIYLTDPTKQTYLMERLDSLGNVILQCSDRDEQYYQHTTELMTIIKSLKEENTTLKKEKESTQTTVVETRKSFWRTIWDAAKWIVISFLVLIAIAAVIFFKSKLGALWK